MLLRPRSRILSALIATAALSLAALPAAAQSPSPVASAAPVTFPFDESTALPAVPKPGSITEPAAIGWDHVTVWPDGRTLTIWFWNGAEGCFGLERIEVEDTGAGLRITPFVGFRADATNVRCIASMQLYQTVVELPSPILGGGTPGLEGVQAAVDAGQAIAAGAPVTQLEPQPWDRVTVWPDGVTTAVHFTGGAADCYGLGRVDTPVQDGFQVIVVYYGPTGGQQVCDAMAVFYWTPVTLTTPLLLGGAV
jgi:hypothetical protein